MSISLIELFLKVYDEGLINRLEPRVTSNSLLSQFWYSYALVEFGKFPKMLNPANFEIFSTQINNPKLFSDLRGTPNSKLIFDFHAMSVSKSKMIGSFTLQLRGKLKGALNCWNCYYFGRRQKKKGNLDHILE